MSPRRWQTRIEDVLSAIQEIQSFVAGLTLDEFRKDAKTLRAVIADFIIIGEAAASVPEEVQAANASVPWAIMRGMRNTLVHAYFDIDAKILWGTIQQDLPSVVAPLRSMLEESRDPRKAD